MGTKNEPGDFDCYANADPDEPLFTLLARDPLAPFLVCIWAAMRLKDVDQARLWFRDLADASALLPPIEIKDQLKAREAEACAGQMRSWRVRVGKPRGPSDPPDGKPPSSDTRLILAAIERLNRTMADNQSKTAAAIAALTADVTAEETVISGAVTLINGIPATVSAAVAEALANAGVDDQAQADALAALDASLKGAIDPLQAALTANTPPPGGGAGDQGGDAGAGAAPAPVISPASISGTAGQTLSGQFALSPAHDGAVTWRATDNPPDISIAEDGTISGSPAAAEAGDMKVDALDDTGALIAEALVPYTISAAEGS